MVTDSLYNLSDRMVVDSLSCLEYHLLSDLKDPKRGIFALAADSSQLQGKQ